MSTGDPLIEGKTAVGSSLTGVTAATAARLTVYRMLSLTGDVTGSTTFDGASNKAISCALANTGVAAATYVCVSGITVDAKGRVTAVTTA
jgi:hypothetical protein